MSSPTASSWCIVWWASTTSGPRSAWNAAIGCATGVFEGRYVQGGGCVCRVISPCVTAPKTSSTSDACVPLAGTLSRCGAARSSAASINSSTPTAQGQRSIRIVSAALLAGEVTSARRVPLVNATATPGLRSDESLVADEDISRPRRTSGLSARTGRICSTQQGLPELPVAHELQVLLEVDHVPADAGERLAHMCREQRRQHLAHHRLGQILQASAFRTLDELVEVDRQIRLLEMLVEDIRVGRPGQPLGFAAHELVIGAHAR